MLLGRGKFIGPLQVIRFGNYSIKHVPVSRCLVLYIDFQLNWKYHVSVVIKAFTQKLNLLKPSYFLPIKGREDIYFKVITSIRNLWTNNLEFVWQDPHG